MGKSVVKYTGALWCFELNNKVIVAKTFILIFLRAGKSFLILSQILRQLAAF